MDSHGYSLYAQGLDCFVKSIKVNLGEKVVFLIEKKVFSYMFIIYLGLSLFLGFFRPLHHVGWGPIIDCSIFIYMLKKNGYLVSPFVRMKGNFCII